MFFNACVLCSLRLSKLRREGQKILNIKPHRKVTQLKSKFSLILG